MKIVVLAGLSLVFFSVVWGSILTDWVAINYPTLKPLLYGIFDWRLYWYEWRAYEVLVVTLIGWVVVTSTLVLLIADVRRIPPPWASGLRLASLEWVLIPMFFLLDVLTIGTFGSSLEWIVGRGLVPHPW